MGQAKRRKEQLGDLYGKIINTDHDRFFFSSGAEWNEPVDPNVWRPFGEEDDGSGIYRMAHNKSKNCFTLLRKHENGLPVIA